MWPQSASARKPGPPGKLALPRPGTPAREDVTSTNERLRFSAREAVLKDKTLSPGARFFYAVLDDISGFKGESWHRQATMAERYGLSVRTIQVWLTELSKYVKVIRQQRTAIYWLTWSPRDRRAISDTQRAADQIVLDTQRAADQIRSGLPLSSLYMNQEIEPSTFFCEKCDDFGVRADGASCDCPKGREVYARRMQRRRA